MELDFKENLDFEDEIEHELLFEKIKISDFDPLNFSEGITIRDNAITKNIGFNEKFNQNVNENYNNMNTRMDINIANGSNLISKFKNFILQTEKYLTDNDMGDIIPRGINEEQTLSVIFYKLFKLVDVPKIDSIYLTAKELGIPIPQPVYEILKVCRLSYHGSITLFKEIGSHTKFHPFYYDNVLQQALYVLANSTGNNIETFNDFNAVFTGARYFNIPLSGRIINRALYVIALYKDYSILELVLEYGMKQNEISVSCITDAFIYFKDKKEIYTALLKFFVTHNDTPFLETNLSLILNRLIMVVCELEMMELLIEILQHMIEKSLYLNEEALDGIFSSAAPTSIENLMDNIVECLLDKNEDYSFETGPFSKALWAHFTKMVEDGSIETTLPLLPLLVKTDKYDIDKALLIQYYNKMCAEGLNDSVLCKIRGFIQTFDLL